MPKTYELTPFERGEIVGLSKGGHSVRNISFMGCIRKKGEVA